MVEGWRYSNYGMISTSAPHKKARVEAIVDWKKKSYVGGAPLYIQYTSDFDCGKETEWWYCIKDSVFDINTLKSKRRYEINQGLKNFTIKRIEPKNYIKRINEIRSALFAQYPDEYRTKNNDVNVELSYNNRTGNWISIGAFSEEDLCGYLDVEIKDGYIDFTRMCVIPEYEKQKINFALVYGLLQECAQWIENGYYLCDGARTIRHKTSFQDWLIRYFGFRKAFCRLHIEYKPCLRLGIWLFSPIMRLFANTHNRTLYNLYCFVKMADIAKTFD